jgi:hypothetical protein
MLKQALIERTKTSKNGLFFNCFFKVTIVIISAVFLTACAHKMPPQQLLGISEAQWLSYDKNKQKELLEAYKQVDLMNQTEDQQTLQSQQAQGQQVPGGQQVNQQTQVNAIKVKVYDGSALMPPYTTWQAFTPAIFTVREGSCQNVDLVQLDGMVKTSLRSCYKDKMLRLDPSHYELNKLNGTATIPYSPLWDQGFIYHNINSYGYVKLKNVTIAIKQDSF